ncbi:MAG: putative methyltransferase [Caldiserica bacterium]|nr:MAG: putative methyltransferase [Caldisericota bacterium]
MNCSLIIFLGREVFVNRTEEQLLRTLLKSSKSLWELINHQDGDIKHTIELLNKFKSNGLIRSDRDRIALTEKGIAFAREYMISPERDFTCSYCEGTGYAVSDLFSTVTNKFKEVFKERPRAIADFDQGIVPPEVSVRRAEFVYQRGDLENKKIFFLGDDDLTSIAMALTGLPDEIHVVEIDRRIVNYINSVAYKMSLNVKAELFDARKPLQKELCGKFDTFLTDPVETVPGIRLFISRCVSALKGEGGAGYFGLSHYESSLKKWFGVEKDLLNTNLVITDVIRDFNKYLLVGERIIEKGFRVVKEAPFKVKAPDYPWYRSTFFRVELVGEPHLLITEEVQWERELYFDEDTYVALP